MASIQLPSPVVLPPTLPQQRYFPPQRFQTSFQKNNVFNATQFRPHAPALQQGGEFDGKRLRKAVVRKTIDYNAAIVRQLELRVWQRDSRDHRAIQPDAAYYPEMVPPPIFVHNPVNAVTTKFVRTSTNKMRCPIFCVAWTPEGRRLVTGASSGEFTLWNGLTFNFETILQAHDSPVRCMVWSHTDQWMVTGDHAGFVKYWQSNMNNVKMFQAHKEPLRGISFCPTDTKFATCSDDGTVRIWDFLKCYEEKILRGHGADVKCVAWHPHKGLLVSGSKDSQQPIKLWDPKSGQSLATLHAHKSTVMEAKWNENGNWLLTGSRDHLIKLFDIRKLNQEVQTFRGHKKEVSSLAWHPIHESLFSSGGSDGAIMFWISGVDKEVGCMEQAHDSIVWSLAWHPLGHILCSGSNDHTCKFWTRNRPGDTMRDKYNLNMLVGGVNPDDSSEYDDISMAPSIPGMGLDHNHLIKSGEQTDSDVEAPAIPGLDFGTEEPQALSDNKTNIQKKIPYSKPIPKQFQQQWMDNKRLNCGAPSANVNPANQQTMLPSMGSEKSTNQQMVVPPPQHMMNVPPPPSGPPQGFPPPPPRMMMPGEGSQRMPIMWPRMSGPEIRMRLPFPPMGNGGQFGPPSMDPNFSIVNNPNEPKNWKEFGDSDFRLPMDSDMRLLNKTQNAEGQPPNVGASFPEDSVGNSEARVGGEGHDQDMRPHLQDTDARMMDFQSGNVAGNSNSDVRGGGRQPGRRGRWGPALNPPPRGGGPFNPPMMPFSNEERDHGPEGDWDERIGQGLMPNPGFPGQMKRGWDVGPGMMDMQNQRGLDGEGGGNNNAMLQRDEGFARGGMRGFPQGRGMPPWGPPLPPRGNMGSGWMRGGPPFRSGPRKRGGGMRGGRM